MGKKKGGSKASLPVGQVRLGSHTPAKKKNNNNNKKKERKKKKKVLPLCLAGVPCMLKAPSCH
jgi:hypothetical protein